MKLYRYLLLALFVIAFTGLTHAFAGQEVQLAKSGKPVMPIIVAPEPVVPAPAPEPEPAAGKKKAPVKAPPKPATQQDHAKTLAAQLQAITAGKFEVKTSTSPDEGIVVGTLADFPSLKLDSQFSSDPLERREQYIIKTHPKGVYIIGATVYGVQNGVWDFLYRVGYRQFFPGKAWEFIPAASDLTVDIDTNQKPDYAFRSIWYGYGTWDSLAAQTAAWQAKNRAVGDFQLNTGHSYDNFIHKNEAIFKEHPEYYGLWEGKRNSTKVCIGNPDLRKLFVAFADKFLTENPMEDSVSVDPSDGGKWCQCDLCHAIGTPSDRALTLANEVAEMIAAKHPDKFVAFYAYNEHAPAPTKVTARPEVIVNVATAFTRGAKVDAIIDGWLKAGVKTFGIREYYSVFAWDMDLPGSARGANLPYLLQTIPHYREAGARFMSAESSDNWGPNGLGFYIATRVMWDRAEAKNVDALKNDFYEKAFGKAREPMKAFYDILLNVDKTPLSSDKVGRLYRQLDLAYKADTDPRVVARLDDLTVYVRYVELYRQIQDTPADKKLAKFEEMIRHVYRSRDSFMTHSKAIYRAGPKYFGVPPIAKDKEYQWQVESPKNPWKQDAPYTAAQLAQIRTAGIAENQLFAFTPREYSADLLPIPARSAQGPLLPVMNVFATRGSPVYYVYTRTANEEIKATVTTGLIVGYRDRGPADVWVEEFGETDEFGPVAKTTVAPDGEPHEVTFTIKTPGLYRLRVSDKMNKSTLELAKGTLHAVPSGLTTNNNFQGRSTGYFYVPKGTRVVGGFMPGNEGEIVSPDGKVILNLAGKGREYFQVAVPAGMDGKFWAFQKVVGEVRLMTVPAYFFRDLDSVLLPEEVVKQDFKK